jgi:lipopolysaccharide export system protein LptA
MDIYRFEAHGGVVIERGPQRITGENALYNVDTGIFTMTDGNLSLSDGQSTITATRSLEYREKALTATAVGNVHIKKENDNLYADRVDARFTGSASGGQPELSYAEATGGVRIVTDTDVITGNSGTYDIATKIATLTGDVKLTRGQNQLNGQFAEVNMATGVSRLSGSPEGGRVEGLLVPSDGGGAGDGAIPVLPTVPTEGQ